MVDRDLFEDLRSLVDTRTPLIVDGGAHSGFMTDKFLGLWPDAAVHGFEANPSLAASLMEKYRDSSNVTIHPEALGAQPGTLEFHVTADPGCSSFFRPTETNVGYHPDKMDVVETIEVPVAVLDDSLADIRHIHLIKLDLQGFELEALKGAHEVLKRTDLIMTEVEFISLYEDQPLFSEVELFLRSHGFGLHNLYNLWTRPEGQLSSGDALFTRS
jgi:FkbM family methyltransferase